MSKVNHRRGFKAQRDGDRYSYSPLGGTGQLSKLADTLVGAGWGGSNHHGHRGYAKAKRGGKKFVRTRIRCKENQATQRLSYATQVELSTGAATA